MHDGFSDPGSTFDTPDDKLDMKHAGGIDLIKMADGPTGMHAIFEPGWTWEKDEKPLLGSPPSCPMHHTGTASEAIWLFEWSTPGPRRASPAAISSTFLPVTTATWMVRAALS